MMAHAKLWADGASINVGYITNVIALFPNHSHNQLRSLGWTALVSWDVTVFWAVPCNTALAIIKMMLCQVPILVSQLSVAQ